MYIINNKWAFLESIENELTPTLDPKGQKTLSDQDLRKIDKKIQPKQLLELFQYFQKVIEILDWINPEEYKIIPVRIYNEFTIIKERIGQILKLIRTIRVVYKLNDVFERLFSDLTKLNLVCETSIARLYELWMNDNKKEEPKAPFSPRKIPNDSYFPKIWLDIEYIKETWFSLTFSLHPWIRSFEEGIAIENALRDIQRISKNQQFLLSELYEFKELINIGALQDSAFRTEYFFFIRQIGALKGNKARTQADKENANLTKQRLDEYIGNLLHQMLIRISSDFELEYGTNASPVRDLPKIISTKVLQLQQQVTDKNENDLSAANKDLQKKGQVYVELIDIIENWLNSLIPYLTPFSQAARKYQSMCTHIRGELGRQFDDFEHYAESVREESERTDLQIILDEKLKALEALFDQYQVDVQQFMQNQLPELKQFSNLILNYNKKFLLLKTETADALKNFRQKNINLQSSLQLWEENFDGILSRVHFTIRFTLANYLSQFEEVLNKEHELFEKLHDISSSEPVIGETLSVDLLLPEKMTELEIRERISQIISKIEEIDKLKGIYSAEKAKYQLMLERFLKDTKNIESKKCVICHKSVKVAEEHFIQCEFCKSLSHYTCAAWWINKYNSCPVCHNQYTIPNNGIYDPDQLEHSK